MLTEEQRTELKAEYANLREIYEDASTSELVRIALVPKMNTISNKLVADFWQQIGETT